MADNILRVGTEFDVGPLVAGAKAAGASLDEVGARAKAASVTMADVGTKMGDASKATLDLLYPTEELGKGLQDSAEASQIQNTAQTETISTSHELALAIAALSAEIDKLAVAKQNASRAAGGMTGAMGAARVEMGLVEGSAGMMASGLARVAAQSSMLAPLITAAFPIVAAIAMIDILEQVVGAFQKAADSALGYTKAVQEAEKEDVKASDAALSHAANLRQAQEKLAEIVKEQGRLAQETFGEKFSNALDSLTAAANKPEGALASLRDALIATAKDPFTPFEAIIGEIEGLDRAEGKAADEAVKLEKANRAAAEEAAKFGADTDKQALKLVEAREAADKSAINVGAASAAEGRVKSVQVEIAALAQKQRLEEDIAAKEIAAKGGTPVDQAAERARVAQEYEYKQIELANNLKEAQIKAADEVAKEQERLARESAEGQKKMQEDLAKAKIPEGANDLTVLGLPNEALFADYYAKLGDDAMEAFKKIRDEGESSSSELDIVLLKDISTLGEEWKKASEKRLAEEKKVNEEIQKENQKTAEMISKIFQNGFDGVIKGTETLRQGFLKLYDDIGLALIHEGEKEIALELAQVARKVAIHLGMEQAKTAATAAGETQRDSLEEIHFIKFVALELKKVAVWIATEAEKTAVTIASEAARLAVIIANHFVVMSHYAAEAAAAVYAALAPIPFVGPFIAPAAAAAAYAAVLAFQAGGVMPHEGMAHLHEQEMVLPANISRPLQAAIPSIQNFNMAMQRDGGAAAAGAAGPGSSTVHNHNGRVEVHVHTPGTQMTHADMVRAVRVAMRSGELRSIP